VAADRDPAETRRRLEPLGLEGSQPLVALLPGSRRSTVAHNLPALLGAAERLADRAFCAIACAPGLDAGPVREMAQRAGVRVALVEGDTYNLLAASDAVAVSSGTATVECALLERPMVVVYRMSALTYSIARSLVKVPYIAMPNLVLGERVVPELIQHEMTAERIAAEISRFLDEPGEAARVRGRLSEVRDALVVPGAADRAAALALEMLPAAGVSPAEAPR